MAPAEKLITIFGATGNQGGSVARSLLQNPEFRVRAITRNPMSDVSQNLASHGAKVFQGNGFYVEEMIAAFRGSWGAFALTNPDGPTEFDLGKNIVDAAAAAGVQYLVFSSGPPCTELTNGKVSMKAMDMKYKIEVYAKQLGSFRAVIPIAARWFLENFLSREVATIFGGFPYFPDDERYLTFSAPNWGGTEQVPWLSITDDFGDIVQGIFLDPERWNGHFVQGVSDPGSFQYLMERFAIVTGQQTRFRPMLPSWEAFDTKGIYELEDTKFMFGFAQKTGGRYFGAEPTEKETARQLKRATATALGRPLDQQDLVSVMDWFAARFGN